ncbi:unnamed protein product [Rhizoctonia solani]|uniref:Zn(2)-C6 fungal-type domain-containing protein n=1 Tax=Rhizoctonia solani TaxID=456999 RepID=A0A8H3DLY4_9AGAM|nr:unnamed protein product [Rhizoctonia solani]
MSSSSKPYAKASRTGRSESRSSLMRDISGCLTCQVRQKKCSGVEVGQSSCSDCLRLNIQCLGASHSRPAWLRDSEALKETKRRIKSHLTQFPVPRGRAPGPERPYLDFVDLIEKYSPRSSIPEEYDRSAGLEQLQQMLPELPSPTNYSSEYFSVQSSYSLTRWPSPEPSYSPTPPLPAYPYGLFSPPDPYNFLGGSMDQSGMMNQGFFYNQQGAIYHENAHLPQNDLFSYVPHESPFLIDPIYQHPQYTSEISRGSFQLWPRPDLEIIKIYYTVYRGLSHGSSSRKALPTELVLYICRLAGFERWHTKKAPEGRKGVYKCGPRSQSLVWFQTEPFTRKMLGRIKSVQLVTISNSGGFMDGPNTAWFELQVAQPIDKDTPLARVKCRPSGDEMSWSSHRNADQVSSLFVTEHKGAVFGPDHELWNQIEEGDVLQAVAKAPLGFSCYTASDGVLNISTWWEPSLEMLALMSSNA